MIIGRHTATSQCSKNVSGVTMLIERQQRPYHMKLSGIRSREPHFNSNKRLKPDLTELSIFHHKLFHKALLFGNISTRHIHCSILFCQRRSHRDGHTGLPAGWKLIQVPTGPTDAIICCNFSVSRHSKNSYKSGQVYLDLEQCLDMHRKMWPAPR